MPVGGVVTLEQVGRNGKYTVVRAVELVRFVVMRVLLRDVKSGDYYKGGGNGHVR